MLHSTGHIQRVQLKTEKQNINNCQTGDITYIESAIVKQFCVSLTFNVNYLLLIKLKHYLTRLYLRGIRYTIFPVSTSVMTVECLT